MKPQQDAAEYRLPCEITGHSGFNEAAARCCGIYEVCLYSPVVPTGASMRPQQDGAEYIRVGLPSKVLMPASTRPQQDAAEYGPRGSGSNTGVNCEFRERSIRTG